MFLLRCLAGRKDGDLFVRAQATGFLTGTSRAEPRLYLEAHGSCK